MLNTSYNFFLTLLLVCLYYTHYIHTPICNWCEGRFSDVSERPTSLVIKYNRRCHHFYFHDTFLQVKGHVVIVVIHVVVFHTVVIIYIVVVIRTRSSVTIRIHLIVVVRTTCYVQGNHIPGLVYWQSWPHKWCNTEFVLGLTLVHMMPKLGKILEQSI